jgi:hypothetical protein
MTASQVTSIAQGTDAVAQLTGQRGTNHDLLESALLNDVHGILVDLLVAIDDQLPSLRMSHGARSHAPDQALVHILPAHVLVSPDPDPSLGATIVRVDDDVLRDVNQATRQVPSVSRAQGRIG